MSNSGDDKLLDEYLSGSTPYSSHYRRIESEEVPLDLDRAVLEQARSSVAKRRSQFWWRVGPTLAIAATAVLTVSILTRTSVDSLAPSKMTSEEDLHEVQAPPAPEVLANSGGPDVQVISSQDLTSRPTQTRTEEQLRSRAKEKSTSDDRAHQFARENAAKAEEKQAEAAKDARAAADLQYRKKVEVAQAASADPTQKLAAQAESPNQSADFASPARGVLRNAAPSAAPVAAEPLAPIAQSQSLEQRGAPNVALKRSANDKADRRRESAKGGVSEIEDVIVTGSRINRSAQDAAIAISVIDGVDRKNPANWLKYIRQLRKDGMDDKADEEWEMLIAAYPDFLIAKGDTARPKNEANKK